MVTVLASAKPPGIQALALASAIFDVIAADCKTKHHDNPDFA